MESTQRLIQLQQWYEEEPGKGLLTFESKQIERILSSCYGYQLLQIGGASSLEWLKASPIRHHFWLNPSQQMHAHVPTLFADITALPFEPHSLDVVILPHVLECVEDATAVIAEATQALAPNGYLILTGINRLSLWGTQQKWRQWRKQPSMLPWLQYFHPLYRISKLLMHFQCAVEETVIGHYMPPSQSEEVLQKWAILKWLGPVAWPALGAGYVVLARKLVAGMTPLWALHEHVKITDPKIGLASQNSTKA